MAVDNLEGVLVHDQERENFLLLSELRLAAGVAAPHEAAEAGAGARLYCLYCTVLLLLYCTVLSVLPEC